MRVDFYQLTRDPADRLVSRLAQKIWADGQRLLIVTAVDAAAQQLSDALWAAGEEQFLAHALASDADAAHAPIIIGDSMDAANGADHMVIADGIWRDPAADCQRLFFLFTPDQVAAARASWRNLSANNDAQRHYWRQEGRGWQQVA
jgi:DNA polymerase-3 subunit chi